MSKSPSINQNYKIQAPSRTLITCMIPQVSLNRCHLSSKNSDAQNNSQQGQLRAYFYKLTLELGPQFQTANLDDSDPRARQSVIAHLKKCGIIQEGDEKALQLLSLKLVGGQTTRRNVKAFQACNQLLKDTLGTKEQQYNFQTKLSDSKNSPSNPVHKPQSKNSIKQDQFRKQEFKLLNPQETISQGTGLNVESREIAIQVSPLNQKLNRTRNSAYVTLTFVQVCSADAQDEQDPQNLYMKQVQLQILLVEKTHKMKPINIENQVLKNYTIYIDQQCKTRLAKGALAVKDKNFYCKKNTWNAINTKSLMEKSKQINKQEKLTENASKKGLTLKKECSLLGRSFAEKSSFRAIIRTNAKVLEPLQQKYTHPRQDNDSHLIPYSEQNSLDRIQIDQQYQHQHHNQESSTYGFPSNPNLKNIKDAKFHKNFKAVAKLQSNGNNQSTFRVSRKRIFKLSKVQQNMPTELRIPQAPPIFKDNLIKVTSNEEDTPLRIDKSFQRKRIVKQERFQSIQDQFQFTESIQKSEQQSPNQNNHLRSQIFSATSNFRDKNKSNVDPNSEVRAYVRIYANKIGVTKTKA